MNESFVQQLEDRVQEHRRRISDLEKQRAHVEEQIQELGTLLPHYEAVIATEKSLEGGRQKARTAARAS